MALFGNSSLLYMQYALKVDSVTLENQKVVRKSGCLEKLLIVLI